MGKGACAGKGEREREGRGGQGRGRERELAHWLGPCLEGFYQVSTGRDFRGGIREGSQYNIISFPVCPFSVKVSTARSVPGVISHCI